MRAAAKPIFLAIVLIAWPTASRAQDEIHARGENTLGPCQQLGLNVWGVSYHPNRSINYNEKNWGAGMTCYMRPDARWLLGSDPDNQLVLEGDAMLNSWRGLMVPVSLGVNYRLKSFANGCKLFFVGAAVAAYYQNPIKGISEVDVGPVPGFAFGCGAIRSNVMLVPSASAGQRPLAAVIASWTVRF